MFAKLRHAAGDSLKREDAIPSGVAPLFQWSSPFHVSGLIALAVVNALKRFALRPLAHVVQEILKGHPPVTDTNAAFPVVLKGEAIRVCASLNHRGPTMVGRREFPATVTPNGRVPMLCELPAHLGIMVAPTRSGVSRTKTATGDLDNLSAFALAFAPSDQCSRRYSSRRKFPNHFELSKGLSQDRYCSRHNVMALCSAAGFGYRPNARCASFMAFQPNQVNASFT